jgi:hypothetical protein
VLPQCTQQSPDGWSSQDVVEALYHVVQLRRVAGACSTQGLHMRDLDVRVAEAAAVLCSFRMHRLNAVHVAEAPLVDRKAHTYPTRRGVQLAEVLAGLHA